MKKVCLVVASLKCGGMERVMSELAFYFASKRDIATHLILLTKSIRFYDLPDNVVVHEPSFNYKDYAKLFSAIKTLFFLRRKLISISPDAVLSFVDKYNIFVLTSCFFLKFNIFISERSQLNIKYGFFKRILIRSIYKRAAGIITQTERAKQVIMAITKHPNITVIGNPIKKIKNNKVEKENIILNVGRMIKSKRQELLMEVFSKTDFSNWKLVFLGKGAQGDSLKRKAETFGISSNVVFAGEQKNIDEYYCKSKIFAFTSYSEGFPNALGEALSTPLASISFDCSAGVRDLIKNSFNGYLIPLGDIEQYKCKLSLLMQDEKLREYFEKNAKICIEEYSINNIGEKFYNFILKESYKSS